jgi:hypothetical protein
VFAAGKMDAALHQASLAEIESIHLRHGPSQAPGHDGGELLLSDRDNEAETAIV